MQISGVPGGYRPEFATTVGLLVYAQTEEFKRMSGFLSHTITGRSFFRQMASWFKENLRYSWRSFKKLNDCL